MLFFQVLKYTDMKKRNSFWCVKTLLTSRVKPIKVLTHLKPPHRFSMLFFDILPFTMLASSVNGKTSKKGVKNDAAVFGVSRGSLARVSTGYTDHLQTKEPSGNRQMSTYVALIYVLDLKSSAVLEPISGALSK